jgi:CHASE2 domain-containing sensor protein
MSSGDTKRAASQQRGSPSRRRSSPASLWPKLGHRLLVTGGLRDDARAATIRQDTLAALVVIVFAVSGAIRQFDWADRLADSPFDMDTAYRAIAHGWFQSDATIPVTLVDIDAETYRAWGTPPVTPRDQLTRMLEVVTPAQPAAVVVDIDLSWGDAMRGSEDEGSLRLRHFLDQYRGPALLIFPKRIEPAADAGRRMIASPLDDVFARNEHVAWAHASFETGGGGAVRGWQDWLAVCTASGTVWLPSVATSVLIANPPRGVVRPVAPGAHPSCKTEMESGQMAQHLLVGPALSGTRQRTPQNDAQVISASFLLDPAVARNDAKLFGDRVVFIGATHPGSGDFWLTPSGVRPGVELLANTVRYATLQRAPQSSTRRLAYRGLSLLLFGMFIYFERKLRGVLAYVATTLAVLAVVAVVLTASGDLGVFGALESAILLVILYKALDVALSFVAEGRAKRGQFGTGWRGWAQTALALCRRET